METKQTLIYDFAYLPNGFTMQRITDMYRNDGIVVYNSSAAGNVSQKNTQRPPEVVNIPEGVEIKFIDLDKEELPDFLKDGN